MMSRFLLPLIVLVAPMAVARAAEESPTFSKDVAPLMFKHCAICHRPGEVAPFSLLTFKDASKRAEQLVEATHKRVMPPWKAEPGHGEFRDARRLSDKELATIAAWAKAGAPEGNPADMPQAPAFPDSWPLGKPDLIVKMPKAIEIPADGRDQMRMVTLPLNLQADQTLAAVDFKPGNRKVVHHALIVVDNIGLMRDRNARGAGAQPAPKTRRRRSRRRARWSTRRPQWRTPL